MSISKGEYIMENKGGPRGVALLFAMLYLTFLAPLAWHFSLFLQRQLELAETWRQDDLLRDGEAAALSHALALCDECLDSPGLTNRIYKSGYQCGQESTDYRFIIQDQLKAQDQRLESFLPLTAPRLGKGWRYAEKPSPWETELVGKYARELFKASGGPAEESMEYVAAILDALDLNHQAREGNRFGEGLILTGLETGDQRILHFSQGIPLSGFFDTNMVKGGVYQCFTVRELEYYYDAADGCTNTRIRLSKKPAGGAMKKHWNAFEPYFRKACPKGWPKDIFKGRAAFVSACGGETGSVMVKGNEGEDIFLNGKSGIAQGDYFLRPWNSFKSSFGLFTMRRDKIDYMLLTGLWDSVEYRTRYRKPEGQREAQIKFFCSHSALTGGWSKVESDRRGCLFLGLGNSLNEDIAGFGMEFRQPETVYGRNASSKPLHMEGMVWHMKTGEGEEREANLTFSRPPVLMPNEKFEIVGDFGADFHGNTLKASARPYDMAVPFKVAAAKVVKLDRGMGIRIVTQASPYKNCKPVHGGTVYLEDRKDSGRLMGFPIDKGGSLSLSTLTLLAGDEATAESWLPKPGGNIYLPCFHCDLNHEQVTLRDHLGQDHSTIFGGGDWQIEKGFHTIRERRPEPQFLGLLASNLALRAVPLQIATPYRSLVSTKSRFTPLSGHNVQMETTQATGDNFWKGWNLFLEDGSLYRVRASKGGSLSLDRNPGLKKPCQGLLSPGDAGEFLAGPVLSPQTLLVSLPPKALLPGTLYLAGHQSLRDHKPAYWIAIFNFSTKKWEKLAEARTFLEEDAMGLGRISNDHRDPNGKLHIRILGRYGGNRGYWLRNFYLLPDTQVREKKDERCDSYAVYFNIETLDKSGRQGRRSGVWLLQRRWEKEEPRPRTFLAHRAYFDKEAEKGPAGK